MKAGVLIWIAVLTFARLTGAAELPWITSHSKALQQAKALQKPVLVEFTADWCHYCKVMEKGTLQEPATVSAMQSYLLLQLDYDREPELVRRFGIQGVPAFIILGSDGDEAARTSGLQPGADFVKWLKDGEKALRKQKDLRERMAVERRQLDAALAGADEKALQQAAETLFQWAQMEKMETRNLARDYLLRLVEKRPLLVLEGANHPSLAVRIACANALSRKIGAAFDLDPWAEAKNRAPVVAIWKNRLKDAQ